MDKKEKVIRGLECCRQNTPDDPFQQCGACPYNINGIYVEDCRSVLSGDALELLKEQGNYVSVPFSWLVKFCTHIDFREPMSDEERAERWKEKLSQQFGVNLDG